MTTLNQSAPQPNVAAEKKHSWPIYYTALVRSGYAPVNGLQMYYEIHGTGKPLVTIHPVWGLANVFPQLVRHRQLIAVELQGHGRTADIDRPLTFEQHADDVAALLKHLQIEQADFFGVCSGGIVAVMMAVRHPDLVGRVATYAHEVRNEIDFGQASDFWNQNGQDECILLCRYARLSDEASQRSGIICGRDSRPHHPCDVRSATSRRTRSSSCWQDLEVSTFATPV